MHAQIQLVGNPPGAVTASDALEIVCGSVLVGNDYSIESCDRAFARLVGWRAHDLQGCHLSEVFPDFRWPTSAATSEVQDTGASLRFSRLRLQARHADGARVPVFVSLVQGADGFALLTVRSVQA